MYQLLRASQINMRKSLTSKLEEKHVGLSYLTSGVYMPNYGEYIVMSPEKRKEEVQLLDPNALATRIHTKLLDPQT